MTIKIGIAGLGNHASNRIVPAISQCEDIQLVSFWTRDQSKSIESEEDLISTSSFDEFLNSGIDVVYLATPTGLHYSMGMRVLEAGISLWCEKPMATNISQSDKLIAMARKKNVMLTEAFMFLHHRQAATVKDIIRDQNLGPLRSVSLKFCFPHLPSDNFRYDAALGGGAYLDHGCYLVRALYAYFGDDWQFLGGSLHQDQGFQVDTSGAMLLTDQAGAVASLIWGFGSCYSNELEIIGEDARVIVQMPFTKPATRSCDIFIYSGDGTETINQIQPEDAYLRMIEDFAVDFKNPNRWSDRLDEISSHAIRFFDLQERLGNHLVN